MTAQRPTWWDGVASAINQPKLDWLNVSAVAFVEMAQIQPDSSILDLGCGTAVVALAALPLLGPNHGAVIGIDDSHAMLQESRRIWDAIDVRDAITLYHGDVRQLDTIIGFHQASQNETAPTFDYVFARNLLSSIPENERLAVLQHWAHYRTPYMGRLVVTFSLMDYAGLMLVDGAGQAHRRWHSMVETEWIRGEQAFREFITIAGFQLERIERVGFQGPDANLWEDVGIDLEAHAHLRYTECQQEDNLTPEWSNPDGGFSILFKKQLREEAIEGLISQLMEQLGEGREDGMHLVPFVANLAGVVA